MNKFRTNLHPSLFEFNESVPSYNPKEEIIGKGADTWKLNSSTEEINGWELDELIVDATKATFGETSKALEKRFVDVADKSSMKTQNTPLNQNIKEEKRTDENWVVRYETGDWWTLPEIVVDATKGPSEIIGKGAEIEKLNSPAVEEINGWELPTLDFYAKKD